MESVQVISISCQIVYVDFEGRSDGKSIKNILSKVAPRKIVRNFNLKFKFLDFHSWIRQRYSTFISLLY